MLTGCSYVNRVAARLNPDGSLDFATCDARPAASFEVEWSYPEGSTTPPVVTDTPIVGDVKVGDVFHLNASAPPGNWESVSVNSVGYSDGGWISGYFDAKDLASGRWVWNQTGIFVGTVDVAHCVLDEANAR
jgi:hypothetical protein